MNNLLKYFFKLNFLRDNQNIKKNNSKLLKKVLFSVLKSPHVNKSAQEQFESKEYKTSLVLYTKNYLRILIFLKIFINSVYSDSNVRIIFFINKNIKVKEFRSKFHFKKIASCYLTYFDLKGGKLYSSPFKTRFQ